MRARGRSCYSPFGGIELLACDQIKNCPRWLAHINADQPSDPAAHDTEC